MPKGKGKAQRPKSKKKSSKHGGGMPHGAGVHQQQRAMAGAVPAGYQQQPMSSATSHAHHPHGYPPSSGAPYGSGGHGSARPSSYAGAGPYPPSGTVAMGHQPPAVDPNLIYLQARKKPTKSDKAVLKLLKQDMPAQAAGYPGRGHAMVPTMSMGHQPQASTTHDHPYFTRSAQPAGYPGQEQGQAMASYGGYSTYPQVPAGMPQQAGMPSQPVAYPGSPMNAQMPPQNYAYPQTGQVPAGPPHGPGVPYHYGQQ